MATIVAEAASPHDIFAAVVDEIADSPALQRIEMVRNKPGTATLIGAAGDHPLPPAAAGRSTARA